MPNAPPYGRMRNTSSRRRRSRCRSCIRHCTNGNSSLEFRRTGRPTESENSSFQARSPRRTGSCRVRRHCRSSCERSRTCFPGSCTRPHLRSRRPSCRRSWSIHRASSATTATRPAPGRRPSTGCRSCSSSVPRPPDTRQPSCTRMVGRRAPRGRPACRIRGSPLRTSGRCRYRHPLRCRYLRCHCRRRRREDPPPGFRWRCLGNGRSPKRIVRGAVVDSWPNPRARKVPWISSAFGIRGRHHDLPSGASLCRSRARRS